MTDILNQSSDSENLPLSSGLGETGLDRHLGKNEKNGRN
jgi:hypothetical protein